MEYEDLYEWQERGSTYYYYSTDTGKVIGTVSKLVSNDIWIAVVNEGIYTFTLDDQKHLGQYIDVNFAKDAVEHFWAVQNRTLIGR